MSNKKFIIGLFTLSVLSGVGFTAKADDTIDPNVTISGNGNVNLHAPADADKVITDTDNQVKYQIDDGVAIENVTNGDNLIAPVTVDSQITSDNGNTTEGVTTLTADFSQAEVIEGNKDLGINFGTFVWGNLFGTKAFAGTQNQTVSDKTYSISFKLNIAWTVSNGYAGITKVTGGYGTAVDKVYVSGSSVTTATNGQVKGSSGYTQQVDNKNLGTNSSWSVTRNYKPVKVPASGAMAGATYYATLKRGNSTWKFQTTNRAY
ncbi:hypothetical protein ACI1S3_10380 [Lactococcus garvieae]|uniref:hypothetical protein n=1 Tax=Lactococcus TaxID=1357 RepID=UPI00051FF029|nr:MULTISPECIES: hypothetical protein [Lactococcus]NHI66203.1 hypothetical protein [Lactococcus petauri]QQB43171.1 hypothetical protein I6H59_00130 [Lactococcus garvieae]CEF52418.1 hypothetical protein LGMT14_02350 [Lactococcus garvieae]